MSCHIGSPLQCGHSNCKQIVVSDVSASRGHINHVSLRNHSEKYFNLKLQAPSKLYFSSQNPSEVRWLEKPLPNDFDYERQYAGGSSWYLSKDRRNYRLKQNRRELRLPLEEIKVRGDKICSGFSYGQRHFSYADKLPLTLDTAMVIFVPSAMRFTIAPICEYCIYAISRSVAAVPVPFGLKNRQREGLDSSINDHASFREALKGKWLGLSPKAQYYAERKKLIPEDLFHVDFETVRYSSGLTFMSNRNRGS